MPLSQQSIVDPGEVQSRAPLKKSTVGWILGAIVLLALIGVFAPRLFRSGASEEAPKAEKPIGVGQARAIDGEFEDAERRARQARPAASAPLPNGSPVASATPEKPVVPPDARRPDNSGVLYGKQVEQPGSGSAGSQGGGAIEVDAAARNSTSVKADFGEANEPAAVSGTTADSAAARLRSMLPDAQPQAPSSSSADAASRIASVLESQRKGEQAYNADRSWLKEFASDAQRQTSLKPYMVSNPFTLLQGKALPAVLGRNLNSDLPGEITAFTTEDVYDSLSSRHLLIPRGSMLAGRYSSAVKTGQERILFAFSRIVLPNGVSVDLPGNPGADVGGAAGITGDVNNHFFKQFASSFLVAFLADKAESGKQGPSVLAGGGGGGAVSAAGQVLVDVSKTILERNKNIPPTITVEKGTRIIVEVTRDMEFAGPYRSR